MARDPVGSPQDSGASAAPLLLGLEKLCGRWRLMVLQELLVAPRRFSELQRRINGISGKSLARVLEQLERDGLVSRRVLSTRPPRVAYNLIRPDPLLLRIIESLSEWGQRYSSQHAGAASRRKSAPRKQVSSRA